ncbi:MAG: epoxyqueuosine reductase QueH [Oscillospiraceae bacterium]|nr:epoxyqueuosine reductase QueH [Oscillospiraceae bacterium]
MENIQNKNYQRELDSFLSQLETAPSLLLHSCCAPCSSYVLLYLSDYFKITVFYFNPNIAPQEEYQKRLLEQKKFIKKIATKNPVDFIEGDYDHSGFLEIAKGLESEPECGKRCHVCYGLRLNETARLAKKRGFDFFTTTLSVSPHKNAAKINEIGLNAAKLFGAKFLCADFKKKNGYKRSIELSKEYNLYRQDYCGCEFSKRKEILNEQDRACQNCP